MKRINPILLLILVAGLAACQSKEGKKTAHFRAVSMIEFAPATLSIQGQGKNKHIHQTFSLGYAKSTGYHTLAPGHYKITLLVKGKPLLKGTYALGKNGYYTLVAMGLLPEKWEVNPETTMYHLKHIFAGEELESANSYLPQWLMMRDNYGGSKSSGYLRIVNANPHTAKLTVKKKKTAIASGLAYPLKSEMIKLKPGEHPLNAFYGNVELGQQMLSVEPGYIYTAIIGKKKASPGKLILRVLKNPSRTLLHAK